MKVNFKKLEPIQYLALGGFVFLLIASYCSIFMQEDWAGLTLVPCYKIVIPAVNILSTILCALMFLFPKNLIIIYSALTIESILSTMTGIESLGIYLFSLMIILIYLDTGFVGKKIKIIVVLMYIAFTIVLLSTFVYGRARFFMAFGCTYFFAFAFYSIILTYKKKLKALIPAIQQELFISKEVKLPKSGEVMRLKDYDISDRQKMILYEVMTNNKTYGEIAIKHNLSTSLVKKDMTVILKYFGCKNANSLKLVLSQFVLSME